MNNASNGAVRVLLGFLSVVLSIVLTVSLLATALVVDYRQLTSRSNLEKTVSQLFSSAPARVRRSLPAAGAAGTSGSFSEAEQLRDQAPEALADWIYSSLKEQYGDEIAVTPEQVQSFMEKSSVGDYVTEKVVSYADDFINGTRNTAIPPQELRALFEENRGLIESELGIEVTDETLDVITSYVADMKLDEVIRTEVLDGLEKLTLWGTNTDLSDEVNSAQGGYTLGKLMEDLRRFTSDTALTVLILVDVLLIAALFFTRRMRLPGTMVCTGVPMLLAGGLVALPAAALQVALDGNPLGALVGAVAVIHYVMVGLGLVLLIAAAVLKAIMKEI